MDYRVRDIGLALAGNRKIDWARAHMPVLLRIEKCFIKTKPLKKVRIGACLHITKETAVLIQTLHAGGAEVALCPSNPLSTQDDVAAALAKAGIKVFGWRGQTKKEYSWCIDQVLNLKPQITLDDGADLINTIHIKRKRLIDFVLGGQEETTTGVLRLRAMAKEGELKYPVIAVNNAKTKMLFDNRYGTGSSTIDGIMRATNILLAGKNFVVAGYGWCGRGIAMRARGMGAKVIVTEVDPVKALEAAMDGYRVMPMREAAKIGDVFVTATGDKNVIRREHFEAMKDGAILANSGHFDVEICLPDLERLKKEKRLIRENVEEYRLKNGKKLYLLAKARLVNLCCAEGHPSEVMQMSFGNQALCCTYLLENHQKLENKVYDVPAEIDEKVARLALDALGIKIDKLTLEQKKYLSSWRSGT